MFTAIASPEIICLAVNADISFSNRAQDFLKWAGAEWFYRRLGVDFREDTESPVLPTCKVFGVAVHADALVTSALTEVIAIANTFLNGCRYRTDMSISVFPFHVRTQP